MISSRQFRMMFAVSLALVPLLCLAAKDFSMPKVQPAASYPAHDYHSNERVTVALDPYDSGPKTNIFVVHYKDIDLLPVLMVVTNDSDAPIEIADMRPQLVTSNGDKLSPANEDDVYRRVSHPTSSGTRVPVPFPTGKVKGGVKTKEFTEIQNAQFKAKAVEPMSTQAGFLFFDISEEKNPLPGSHFYLTGVHDSSGNDLMYFEIALDKYLQAAKH